MAFANSNVSDLIATGIESRTREIADNVLKNNPITAQLKLKGRTKTFSGGHKIYEELSFAENPNGGAYSGYDILPVSPADVISAAEYNIRQYAVPVIVSGLELLQNSGKEKILDIVDARLDVAESTMANILEVGVYGDGTGYGGKAIQGMAQFAEATATGNQTSTVGGISRATWSFWRSYYVTGAYASSTITVMNTAWAALTRGPDSPDLIVQGADIWGRFLAALQLQQRFTNPQLADLGFPTLKFMTADVVLGGGIGGVVDAKTTLFINSKYLRWRPHADCNMVPLSPTKRYSVNQDAQVQILAWAGNLTCRGSQFQGRTLSSD